MSRKWSYIETQKKMNADYSATSTSNQELVDILSGDVYTDISFNAIDALTLIMNKDTENPIVLMGGTQLHITEQHIRITSLVIVEAGRKYSYVAGKVKR